MLILNTGTQYVEGILSFDPGFQIFLYESVFSQTGEYVLFDYSAGSFPGGQLQLNSNVSVIAVDLKLSHISPSGGISVLEDQPEHNRVIVKLLSKPSNGKQWIEGDLVFSGPTTLYLDQYLFTTLGVYDLFEVTGNIFGIENLTVIHGGGWFIATPYINPLNPKILSVGLERAIGLGGSNVSQAYAYAPILFQQNQTVSLEDFSFVECVAIQMSTNAVVKIETALIEAVAIQISANTVVKIETASIEAKAFELTASSQLNVQNSTIESLSFDPELKSALSPIKDNNLNVFNPNLVCKLNVETAVLPVEAFQLRTTLGFSHWYDYFPMASFKGEIGLDSEFKIMLLSDEAAFISSHKSISEISRFKIKEKVISLKRAYVDDYGRAIYDFDSVTWESANFTFSNAVIYANDILVLHIDWAIPFSLNGESFTLNLPDITPKAQTTANFGTLELEPLVRYPSVVSVNVIDPLFPYVFPSFASVEVKAYNQNFAKLSLDYSLISTNAFELLIESLAEAQDPPLLIELEADEDFSVISSNAFDPYVIQSIKPENTIVESYVFDPKGPQTYRSLESHCSTEINLLNPNLVASIEIRNAAIITEVIQDINLEFFVSSVQCSVYASAFLPEVIQKIKIDLASISLDVLSPDVVQLGDVENIVFVDLTVYNPNAENTMSSPLRPEIHLFNPNLEQKIFLNTAVSNVNAIGARFARDESFWYDYFPMASFEGEISLESEFKIMLLDREGVFNSTHRNINEVSRFKIDDTKTIALKGTYINDLGEAIYDFDSVTWESANFTFSNAVIYANDILVLHISWANPYKLLGQDLTLQPPNTFALARPVMTFGTLEFEPYVRFAASIIINVIDPLFPYIYSSTPSIISRAINPGLIELNTENIFVDVAAFDPNFSDIPEADNQLILELDEEDVCYVYAVAIDFTDISVINADYAVVTTKVFDLKGPPVVRNIEEFALVRTVEVCSPIVENISEIIPQPEISATPLSLCSDPFVEWKPTNRISMQNYSKLIGYWPLNRGLVDESIYDNNIDLSYSVGDENTLLNKFEEAKFKLGFRGNSVFESGQISSDRLEVNSKYGFEKNFSSQIWVKFRDKRILQEQTAVLLEQFDGCWGTNRPVFPGGLGWTLFSTPVDDENVKFSFFVVNSRSSLRVEATFSIDIDSSFSDQNAWHHFACVRRGDKLILYVDGVKFDSTISEGDITDSDNQIYESLNSPLTIGCSSTGLPGICRAIFDSDSDPVLQNGSTIDDIAIWRKSLSDEDISYLWAGGAGNPADSLPLRRTNINTRTIDRFRQGTELTQEIYFHVGIFQSYSGDKVHHRLLRNDFGLQIWDYGNCKHYFVDKESFNEEEIVQTSQYERYLIGERRTTDGVINVNNLEGFKTFINTENNRNNSMGRTSFGENNWVFIPDLPASPFLDDKINISLPSIPFNDDFDPDDVVLTGIPNGFISQPNGTDYDLRVIRGTDSFAFGGETY